MNSRLFILRFLSVSVASIAGEAHPMICPVSASCCPYTAEKPLYLRLSISISRFAPSLPSIGNLFVINAWCLTGKRPVSIPSFLANLSASAPKAFINTSVLYSAYSLSGVSTITLYSFPSLCTSTNFVFSSIFPPF